jgi:hypothetical protein
MTFKFKIGLVFAALGYAIVVTIGVQYLTLRIRPLSGHPKAANEGHLKTGQRK